MKTKDEAILEIRGTAIGNVFETSSSEEKFQNQTLRPILKFQNDLFLAVFRNYATKQKSVFFSLTPDKKMHYIETAIQRDIKFRNSLKGIVIGMFTLQEYEEYIQNSSNLNKRMMNLLIERLKSQVQLFEEAA
ncbi:glyoxalase [Flavobacterium chuncheonense]|uniref:Glyoxalase n=1 Tax=Flavobacterium chuncheonense TaxID=2026653 RepID=A0ABW5YHU2_9FLAO